ncbi:PREDICTED: putative glucose-6-phosphate 1-epimerase isoform X2 [Amphimedon queenslandica]|nr:PREDICTED: putative glucose-6-phosphate 1-epimerase isoform X2 [Amphimedon queenslandica]|eukprot:XP_011408306.2 PREDICTED: putative glucose-6-phosphate 1-epimerase isoform X2 [Amphimedon queenslandica]
MIFVSKKSVFDNKKAIRGGIPVVFPCFGVWELGPQHGFARISKWSLLEEPTKDSNGDVKAVFELSDDDNTRSLWNNKFKLSYTVCVMSSGLFTELSVNNLNDSEPFSFTWLLHTYFAVPDVTKCTISGLSCLTYKDKVDEGKEKKEVNDLVTISGFTDRVYKEASENHVITNVAGGKTVLLKKSNFPDTVVWNPWIEKAKSMSDFGDDEYPYMVCVEAGYVANSCTVNAGSSYTSSQTIDVVSK